MGRTRERRGQGCRPGPSEELTVSISEQFVSVIAMHIGEMKYKAECACQRPEGHVLLSKCLHLANYTLTLVWGPPEAKKYDEELAAKAAEQAKAAEEAQRIQLTNDIMFDIECSDDD